ncbi:hypothetical protein MKW98_001001, partial [Papaver atlanticum]
MTGPSHQGQLPIQTKNSKGPRKETGGNDKHNVSYRILKRRDLNAFLVLENESLSQDSLNMHADMVIETVNHNDCNSGDLLELNAVNDGRDSDKGVIYKKKNGAQIGHRNSEQLKQTDGSTQFVFSSTSKS